MSSSDCVQHLPSKDLYVFDFDNTIIEEDSDHCFYDLFEGGKLPPQIASQYDETHWTAFMNIVFESCHENGIKAEQIKEKIEKCKLVPGMKELFQKIKAKGSDIIIVSDANTFFINWLISKNHLEENISAVFTNPCRIEDNQLILTRFFNSHDCPLCTRTPNMCKTKIITQYIEKHPNTYNHIHYFGDGANDFCPIKSLSNKDCTGYARKGFSLERRIAEYNADPDNLPFRCRLVYWENANDILNDI